MGKSGRRGKSPDLVSKIEKMFGEIGAVLARDSSNERPFHMVVSCNTRFTADQ